MDTIVRQHRNVYNAIHVLIHVYEYFSIHYTAHKSMLVKQSSPDPFLVKCPKVNNPY